MKFDTSFSDAIGMPVREFLCEEAGSEAAYLSQLCRARVVADSGSCTTYFDFSFRGVRSRLQFDQKGKGSISYPVVLPEIDRNGQFCLTEQEIERCSFVHDRDTARDRTLDPDGLARECFDYLIDNILSDRRPDIDESAMIEDFRDVLIDLELRRPGFFGKNNHLAVHSAYTELNPRDPRPARWSTYDRNPDQRACRLICEALDKHKPFGWYVRLYHGGHPARYGYSWDIELGDVTAHDRLRVRRKFPKRLPPVRQDPEPDPSPFAPRVFDKSGTP